MACVAIFTLTASAQAQLAFSTCEQSSEFACAHLTVPLDPSGSLPGTLTLAIRRHRAPAGEGASAILALAGGPGQPALPFTETFREVLGPLAGTRDLIVFDQRGIGYSDPLSCHAAERPDLFSSVGQYVEACAAQLGPQRSFFASADTVADIEAIRQAGGYEKLVLYGTSYGTKVAELYAQRYPSHVEGLVLDSVVTPNGPDPLQRPTFAAIPRILRQLCSERACAHITANPIADMTALVARARRAPIRGRAVGPRGHTRKVSVSSEGLLDALIAGDFSPLLRAELLTATSAAVRGDSAPLARVFAGGAAIEAGGEPQDFDGPLFLTTTCEDEPFPWDRTGDPHARLAQASAAARAQPSATFAPFTAADALEAGEIGACAHWPYASPPSPPSDAPLPAVPTLILSGTEDLRTPTSNAREVAAEIPGAHLLLVPHTGHSVLTDEPTPCGREALKAVFAGRPVLPCHGAPTPALLRPPPLPPQRLTAVSAEHGYSGPPGRALHAVALTLSDLSRHLLLQLLQEASESLTSLPTLRVGGLRAGWAAFAGTTISLHSYTYIPGVALTGTLKHGAVELRVAGAATLSGTLRSGSHGELVGTLGGRHVVLPADSRATAAIVGFNAPVRPLSGPGGAGIRAGAGALASALAGRGS